MTEMTTKVSLLAEVKSEATFHEATNGGVLIKGELMESCFGDGARQDMAGERKRKEIDLPDQNNNSCCQQQVSMTSRMADQAGSVKKTKVPSKHFCFICNRDFANEDEFSNHLEQEPNLFHQCTACAQSFRYKRQFLLHKCDFIDYDDPVIRPIVTDETTPSMVDYACKFCTINNVSKLASRFVTYQLYVEHVNKHHRSHINCNLCDGDFKNSFEDYLNHLESEHFIKLAEFDCAFSADGSEVSQNQQNDNEKEGLFEFNTVEDHTIKRCGLCKFTNKGSSGELHGHLLSHVTTGTSRLTLGEHRIYCTHCRMTFNYQHDFDVHLFNHVIDGHQRTPEDCPLGCPICEEREFPTIGQFSSHLNEDHLGFTCGICNDPGFRIQTGHAIEDHYKNVHLNDEILKQIPDYDKKTLSLIRTVIENVFCDNCNRFFNSSTRLEDHSAVCLKADNSS